MNFADLAVTRRQYPYVPLTGAHCHQPLSLTRRLAIIDHPSGLQLKVDNYEKDLEEMKYMTRLEFVASLGSKSMGFSRGESIYRRVIRHYQHGRWQARIRRAARTYLDTFSSRSTLGGWPMVPFVLQMQCSMSLLGIVESSK